MTLETFFEKFDLFAQAPNAVARMRRLILDLAVQGKLVPQEANHEPAVELLKRIQAERVRLVESGEIKKWEPLPPVEKVGVSFSLPSGWAVTQLGDVAVCLDYLREPINGTERDLRIAGKARSELFPYYGATQQQGWIDAYIFDEELVLLGEDGVPFLDVLRPKAYLISGKSWVNNHAHVFRGIFVSNLFVMHWLNTFDYTGRIAGSTRSKLNQANALDIPVALPPLAEQKRIVAKVDQLMALCDRLEAQQNDRETRHAALARASLVRFADAPTPPNLNFLFHRSYSIKPADLRKSILTLAVQGKLVHQDLNDPPVSQALASNVILPAGHVRRRKIKKRFSSSSKPESLSVLPASWEYSSIQTLYDLNWIVDFADGNHGSLYPRGSEFGDSGVLFVTARDIVGGRVLWSRCARLNSGRASQLNKGWAQGGDVLLTHNATVGRVAQVENQADRFLLGTSVTFYRLNEMFIDPSYFYHVLRSPIWQSQLQAVMEQTTRNQVSIQKQALFIVPVPPIAEQRRIAAKVHRLMALADRLETQQKVSRIAAASLFDAIVAELTTQRPRMRPGPANEALTLAGS